MSEPVYTSSNGTTVTDVTDQWEFIPHIGGTGCILYIASAVHETFVVSAVDDLGSDILCVSCETNIEGKLRDGEGEIIAIKKTKPKKYRPFLDCFEFLKMTEGRPVWLRHKDELPFQQVIKVDDYEIETANWTVEFSPVWATFQMSFTPHIADSWVTFGAEVQQESGGAK